jgi:gluconate 5-dehydrogenase
MFDLENKVVIVTGASSGLGADATRAYFAQGARVALFARSKDKMETIAAELERTRPGSTLVVPCDVTNEERVKEAVDSVIDKWGRIDVLLNNAGTAIRGGVHDMTEEDWDKAMDLNVKAQFFVSKYVVPHMIEQKYGKIVNISSVNAKIADKDDTFIRHSYNTSKSAVIGLTIGMAASYGKYGITVNSIGPGLFKSGMTENTLFKSEAFLESYSNQCPMGRPGAQGELNGTILYLSSDASSYVTGQFIVVDGGASLV